jgi:hypothetical protein
MTIAEFEAAEVGEFDGALLALWWERAIGSVLTQLRRTLTERREPGCMLICIERRVIWEMRPIGTV